MFLGDLGFRSPLKVKFVPGDGYFLRSYSKFIKENHRLLGRDRCPSGIFSSCLGPGVLLSEVEHVGCDVSGALRAVHALPEVPL